MRDNRFWLYTKIAEKEMRQQPVGEKEFVNGEGFPYLGRSHRLLLVTDQVAPLNPGDSWRWPRRRRIA